MQGFGFAWLWLCVCALTTLSAQQRLAVLDFSADWTWRTLPQDGPLPGYWSFKDAAHDGRFLHAPRFTHNLALPTAGRLRCRVEALEYGPLPQQSVQVVWPEDLGSDWDLETGLTYRRREPRGQISLRPLRRNAQTGQVEALKKARIIVDFEPDPALKPRKSARNNYTSVLSQGQTAKIAVSETGIYRLTAANLSSLGFDLNSLDPRELRLLGHGNRQLPQPLSEPRIDDLVEIPIFIEGEGDGRFDSQDALIFYAEGPAHYRYINGRYERLEHDYSQEIVYFIQLGSGPGARVQAAAAPSSTNYSTDAYDALAHYEVNRLSLMEEAFALPASGKLWFGEAFRLTRQQSFTLNIPDRLSNEPVDVRATLAVRATSGSTIGLSANGQSLLSRNVSTISTYIYDTFARYADLQANTFIGGSENLNVQINFNNSSNSAECWLDFISAQARARLQVRNGQLLFSDARSLGRSGATYNLQHSGSNLRVWDVTDIFNIRSQGLSGNSFQAITDTLRQFMAFDGSRYLSPRLAGSIPNQNLHSLSQVPDMLIIYHRNFAAAAASLAAHRTQHSGLSVLLVDVEEIYNEFSSGNPDITAIRDFSKMLYDRASNPNQLRYILLMGKGSFDPRNLKGRSNPPNYIPVFVTDESLDPILTFTTDDFFAMLDDGEGQVGQNHDLDVSVGRLPCASAGEAQTMVNKIIQYETDPQHFRDWRNRLLFVADDEDNNIHIRDADSIADRVAARDTNYLISKVYIDAYRQVSTAAGSRYPEARDAIMDELFKGVLVFNYMGHGGVDGLAQERIFTNTEINALRNGTCLPLFVTATCSFAPLDDPNILSAGELLMLNPMGGAIALLTTVRVVYADANERLTRSTFDFMFQPFQGQMPTLGEILMQAKNQNSDPREVVNTRKYMLLGDPAMRLGYPQNRVAVTSINGHSPVWQGDTLSALRLIRVEGEVRDAQNNRLPNFNGTVYPRVFDKVDSLYTLANDPGSRVRGFALQQRLLFRGRATVTNGRFAFSFIVPRSINYNFGPGRFSFYAEDGGITDAAGTYHGAIVGGTYANAPDDNAPPLVEVFMNDEQFAPGGMTDPNPVLYVRLFDESGINITGNGVGNDLLGEVQPFNSQNKSSYTLNNFYETEKDDFTKGKVLYPLRDLPEGQHSVRVQAWDTYNNVGEGSTDFVVSSSAQMALRQVLNYPNPFTTNTRFQFEHNYPNQPLLVRIQIFTVNGRLVKSIEENIVSPGYRVSDIAWDGLDEFGDPLARGVYVYRVTVQAEGRTDKEAQASAYQKLVILR